MKQKKIHKKITRIKKQLRRRLKLTFVPHKANQYRPHLVRRYGLSAVIVLAFGMLAGHNIATSGSVLGVREPISTQDLLADTNRQRKDNDLPPLVQNTKLTRAAFLKGQDMLKQQYWAHTAPDGTTPWQWLGQVGYSYSYAGENLAKNFASADATTAAWMASSEHRSNILDNHYTQVGFAVVSGKLNNKPTSLVVALYGAPEAETAVAGVTHQSVEEAATAGGALSPVARFGIALQSITPAVLGSFILLLIAVIVALAAHFYRKKLPKHLRQSWYRHHGLYKAVGMTSLVLILITLYSGGQI